MITYEINYKHDTNQLVINLPKYNIIKEIELQLPFRNIDINEILHRICGQFDEANRMQKVLKYNLVENDEFKEDLRKYLSNKNQSYHDQMTLSKLKSINSLQVQTKIRQYWSNSQEYGQTNIASISNPIKIEQDEQQYVISKWYHTLMHSHLSERILKKELQYKNEYVELVNQRDLTFRFKKDFYDKNPELMELERDKWNARIDTIQTKQQRKFRNFISKLYNSYVNNLKEEKFIDTGDELENESEYSAINDIKILNTGSEPDFHRLKKHEIGAHNRIEESYTIQLGAQLKSTHNLRLIRCNIMDYCVDRFKSTNDKSLLIEPQSILTAMSLYSDKLSAVVLLEDTNISFSDVQANPDEAKNFNYHISESKNGCDFHFMSVKQQQEQILKFIQLKDGTQGVQLNIGDFYVTKHSNLSQCHVLFHLAASDTNNNYNNCQAEASGSASILVEDSNVFAKNLKYSDLSSRHPVILGLRNILKLCVNHNIQTLSFPLLLTHEMTEEMTIGWVMKRAELVLKCIKGFMIEFVQWGAQESHTLQFVVPQGLMDETFNSISNLIKSIFRESRTVNLLQ